MKSMRTMICKSLLTPQLWATAASPAAQQILICREQFLPFHTFQLNIDHKVVYPSKNIFCLQCEVSCILTLQVLTAPVCTCWDISLFPVTLFIVFVLQCLTILYYLLPDIAEQSKGQSKNTADKSSHVTKHLHCSFLACGFVMKIFLY